MGIPRFLLMVGAVVAAGFSASAFGQQAASGYARLMGNPESRYKRDVAPDEQAAHLSLTVARTGNTKDDPTSWLSPKDLAFALLKANPSLTARAELKIGFNAAGSMQTCTLVESSGSKKLVAGLCDRVRARARLVPPMCRDGTRLPETFRLYAYFSGAPLPKVPLISLPRPPEVIPWPDGKAPAYVDILLAPTDIPIFLIEPKGISAGTAVTGIAVDVESGKATRCRIGKSSGDAAVDQQACQMALRSAYVWSYNGSVWARNSALPMLLVGKGDNMKALPPLTEAGSLPFLKDEARVELAAIARANGGSISPVIVNAGVDNHGHAFDCWVTETSGSDRADQAVCDFLMSGARFEPGKDIFARDAPRNIYRLKLDE
jgi:hypothetical protein